MLADTFCHDGRRLVEERFRALWAHNDVARYRNGQRVLDRTLDWVADTHVDLLTSDATNQRAAK